MFSIFFFPLLSLLFCSSTLLKRHSFLRSDARTFYFLVAFFYFAFVFIFIRLYSHLLFVFHNSVRLLRLRLSFFYVFNGWKYLIVCFIIHSLSVFCEYWIRTWPLINLLKTENFCEVVDVVDVFCFLFSRYFPCSKNLRLLSTKCCHFFYF